MDERKPHHAAGTGMPRRERFRICEVPQKTALLPYRGLADAITPNQIIFTVTNAARLLRSDGSTMELLRNFHHSIIWNV
jgi:hypothetical protein